MRKNFGAKPWLFPEPVLMIATYDEEGNADVMNAAWGGISCDTEIGLCLSEEHKTTQNILKKKAFTVSFATEDTVVACDYVGIVSANDEPDKMSIAGFTTAKAEYVDAPIVCELPVALECRLISYDPENCHLLGEIVNVCACESVLTDGKIDPKKLKPIIYDGVNHDYYGYGNVVGKAFGDGKKLKK